MLCCLTFKRKFYKKKTIFILYCHIHTILYFVWTERFEITLIIPCIGYTATGVTGSFRYSGFVYSVILTFISIFGFRRICHFDVHFDIQNVEEGAKGSWDTYSMRCASGVDCKIVKVSLFCMLLIVVSLSKLHNECLLWLNNPYIMLYNTQAGVLWL